MTGCFLAAEGVFWHPITPPTDYKWQLRCVVKAARCKELLQSHDKARFHHSIVVYCNKISNATQIIRSIIIKHYPQEQRHYIVNHHITDEFQKSLEVHRFTGHLTVTATNNTVQGGRKSKKLSRISSNCIKTISELDFSPILTKNKHQNIIKCIQYSTCDLICGVISCCV